MAFFLYVRDLLPKTRKSEIHEEIHKGRDRDGDRETNTNRIEVQSPAHSYTVSLELYRVRPCLVNLCYQHARVKFFRRVCVCVCVGVCWCVWVCVFVLNFASTLQMGSIRRH